ADLMPRNLDRRVETIFPIEDKDLLKEVKETVLDISLKDNTKSRVLLPSGSYKPVNTRKTEESINLQEWLMHYSTVVKKDDEGVSVSNKNP
ncbi:MAG: RNA degradosome polyphosphate kinase, partial [Melioribacteraceae bacterium]|nr:RNA degradosome polyphosphate kinase [Melioribacteraceae bacterium]